MIGERYTIVLQHELVDLKTGQSFQTEPPFAIRNTMFNRHERDDKIYMVNNMLQQMKQEFLKRVDGGDEK